MKKITFILLAVAVLALAMTGTALANFGPHGGYSTDTDACAGCHRAHSSFSTVTWNDQFNNSHSALLVSGATTMKQFCYACHGDGAPGASTNVASGVFDGAASAASGGSTGPGTPYMTASTAGADLNGGAFDAAGTTSVHDMDLGDALTDPMWGAGTSVPQGKNLTCTDCHDPHGSSNYRLLKDTVNGVAVGGYDANDNPTPFVISRETGYPTGGWLKHNPGASQMTTYVPNYTSPIYAYQPPAIVGSNTQFRSMSVWCSACHTQYDQKASAYNYDVAAANTNGNSSQGMGTGSQGRHRHPVNITLAAGVGPGRALQAEVKLDNALPLEARPNSPLAQGSWDTDDYLGCLTCHKAHGTKATMSGFADATLNAAGFPEINTVAKGGVNPNFSSALLRADNRGVCERCHNK